ncbi:MAG: hypothetical protein R3244_11495 [Thermoanaerobaculia bacterium]|nr:hypothetical protein [Thermoanaerobaculia bacterium]
MYRTLRNSLLSLFAIGLLVALPATAEENPYLQPDDTWISLSGTVEAVSPDAFTLDYGDGIITVEMDDGDRDADAYALIEGDKVTVTGKIDDDFYETTTIEASSVYVENIGTYFYASAVDEEDTFVTVTTPIVVSETVVQGTVTDVRITEFTIDTGLRELTVEVDEMPYDPLDDEGYQKIEVGDRVSVRGDMDVDLFEGRVLEANSIVTLSG